MRGEHAALQCLQARRRGSSPHARGTRQAHRQRRQARGIIPACAGNTSAPSLTMSRSRDHPRMRGEHLETEQRFPAILGSSPHARGTRRSIISLSSMVGIIPACAGNTPPTCNSWKPRRDHPRMRGEHPNAYNGIPESTGSSPHARGTRLATRRHATMPGIIPACAGNTLRK